MIYTCGRSHLLHVYLYVSFFFGQFRFVVLMSYRFSLACCSPSVDPYICMLLSVEGYHSYFRLAGFHNIPSEFFESMAFTEWLRAFLRL